MSAFQALAEQRAPNTSALAISARCQADTNKNKVDLSVGAYRTEEGKPLVLDVVREAQRRVVSDPLSNMEYLGHGGDPKFCQLSAELVFGLDSPVLTEGRSVTFHGISGTGCLRVGCEFLSRFYPRSNVLLLSSPTWPVHELIAERCGLEMRHYRYYKPQTRGLDYEGMLEDLQAAPEGAILMLQACGHTPTGVDPTPEQWQGILQVAKARGFFVFFDNAYQGFVDDLDADGACICLFAAAGLEMMVSQSYSKSMGLYGERAGTLTLVTSDPAVARGAELVLQGQVVLPNYATPSKHGAAIAATVLGDGQLREQWQRELKVLADSLQSRRQRLHSALLEAGAPGTWEHIVQQKGMFSYSGLTKAQCEHLTKEWHIYLTLDGRISLAGLPGSRCQYVAEAIRDAMESCPASA